MTHDEMIAVIQHHKNGGKVEVREIETPHWHECAPTPWWNFTNYEYRAKPEPLAIWAEILHGHVARYALRGTKPCMGGVIKKFVEVAE